MQSIPVSFHCREAGIGHTAIDVIARILPARIPMSQPVIEIQGIEKFYPSRRGKPPVHALKGIDLTVERSTVFCVLGPNGAGKTTLISVLCCLLYPDAGRGTVCGFDLLRQQRKIKTVVNFTSGHANFPDNFTVDEILTYFGMLYGLPKRQRGRKAIELIAFFELGPYRHVPFNELSTGLKQRLALAKSLINDPELLFLDEPTAGLDPAVALLLRSRLQEWQRRKGATIILTTHQMDEAEELSGTIAFLKEGRVIRIGGPEELKSSISFQRRLVVQGRNLKPLSGLIDRLPRMGLLEADENRLTFRLEDEMDSLNPLLEAALAVGASVETIEITKPTLGDVFVELANRPDSD